MTPTHVDIKKVVAIGSGHMEEETFNHLIEQITSTTLKSDPYHHFHTERVFPEDFYLELMENIPDASYFSQKQNYPQRSSFCITKENIEQLPFPAFLFWYKFITTISNLKFTNALKQKFKVPMEQLFGKDLPATEMGIDLALIRDQPGYFIGPHTDHPIKIITLLFYLPSCEEQKSLGTSIYAPKDRSVKYSGHEHHSFKDFDRLFTIPFVRNSVFGFLRSNESFHGVEPINEKEKERISLCCTIWNMNGTNSDYPS